MHVPWVIHIALTCDHILCFPCDLRPHSFLFTYPMCEESDLWPFINAFNGSANANGAKLPLQHYLLASAVTVRVCQSTNQKPLENNRRIRLRGASHIAVLGLHPYLGSDLEGLMRIDATWTEMPGTKTGSWERAAVWAAPDSLTYRFFFACAGLSVSKWAHDQYS